MVNLSQGDQWTSSLEGAVGRVSNPGLSVGVPGSAGEQVGVVLRRRGGMQAVVGGG